MVGRITGVGVGEAVEKVVTEFGDAEVVEVMGGEVRALACLNVFNAEVVDRVVESVGEGVVIVTGQRREEGMKRAKEREVGAVVCVGHRRSEGWGIRWLKGEIGRWSEGRVEAVVVEEVEGDEN